MREAAMNQRFGKLRNVSERRFRELAGDFRPEPFGHEVEWFERIDGLSIGAVILDHADKDYGWVLMGRGPVADKADSEPSEAGFRLVDLGTSLPTVDAAADALAMAACEFNVKTQQAILLS
jgi:hypothetical protein